MVGMQRNEFVASPAEENEESSYEGNNCCVATKQAMILVITAILAVGLVGVALMIYGPTKEGWKNETIGDLEKELNNTVNHIRLSSNLLPRYVVPIQYRLRIQPILNETNPHNSIFNGRVGILIRCEKPSKHITLHSRNLIIHSVQLLQNNYSKTTSRKIIELNIAKNYSLNSDIYQIDLHHHLHLNQTYSLNITFSGKIGTNFQGLYKIKYLDKDRNTKWLITTFFRPTYAREVFPCFDQPTFKAPFEISIGRKTDMKSISNLPLKESEPIESQIGWVWDHFQKSPPMSPHSVTITVLDLDNIQIDTNPNEAGPVFQIWTTSYSINYTDYARRQIPQIFAYLQSYFNVKFPLPKIDFVITPGMSENSQESWGLIAFRDSSFLFNPNESGINQKEKIFKLIVRELCHQWYGDLISLRDWFDIWVIEGFATFMESIVFNALELKNEPIDSNSIAITQTTLKSDSMKFQYSLETKLKNPLELQMIFDLTAYNKGSCLFRMLNFMLTDRIFQKGVQEAVKNHKYETINRTDLWDNFLSENFDLREMMDSWVKQSGYPVVKFERDYKSGSMIVQQKKFTNTNNNSSIQLWYIPLTYITGNDEGVQQTHTIWMNNVEQMQLNNNTELNNSTWLIGNLNQIGLYRVNYDLNNWKLLQQQLDSNCLKIPTNCRSQLISDVFELASFSHLDYKTAFGMIKYMGKNERNYLPWFSIYNALEYLKITIGATSHYGVYRKFVIRLLTPVFDELGTDEKPTDSREDRKLRLLILKLACDVNYDPCVRWARKQFQSWISSPDANPIPFELREIVQCTAIAVGAYQEWEFVWNQTMFLFKSPADLQLGYYTLGCSQEPWIIHSYLEGTLNGNIPLQYVPYVFQSLSNPSAIYYGFTFVRVNWEKLYKTYSNSFNVLKSIFETFLLRLSTDVELIDLTFFYNEYKDQLRSVSPLMLSVVEQIKSRISWREKYLNSVIDLLKEE